MTTSPLEALLELCRRDRRYKLPAYVFLSEAMDYAHRVLGLGAEEPSEPLPPQAAQAQAGAPQAGAAPKPAKEAKKKPDKGPGSKSQKEELEHEAGRHVTGRQLCEAIRLYALEQFGYLAKAVLNHWGIERTGDFGEMVYNLIALGQMRKTKDDRREDFDNVFDFDQGFRGSFRINPPKGD
jgi:uncharacterized repeat protein (TIGR04138 family)